MKLNYISILRAISILIVVVFHSYGYMLADHFPQTKALYTDTYFWINQCVIINVAMPLFTFISGFLFAYIYNRGGYSDFRRFVGKKAQRLLLPFVVFASLMMLTTGAKFAPFKLLITGAFSHLWFMPMLFWCFVLDWGIKRFVKNEYLRFSILVVFLILPVFGKLFQNFLGLQGLSMWFGWFMLGDMVMSYEEKLEQIIKKCHLVVPLIVPFLIQIFIAPVPYADQTWYTMISVVCMIIALWYIFANMGERAQDICGPLIWFSKYSFGIYIFHNWIGPYLISSTAQRLFPLADLAANHVILFPLCLTIAILVISWGLTWCMLKTKTGRFLIG